MTVVISKYSDNLKKRFLDEKKRIASFLPKEVIIEHVGSSAVGIGGKNIVDILIGASSDVEMRGIRDVLIKNGYFEGNDSHDDRIFLASREEETGEGDFHVHICLVEKDSFKDFIILRDYLIANPEKAKDYFEKKRVFAEESGFDRKKYKTLKAGCVSKLLTEAKKTSIG